MNYFSLQVSGLEDRLVGVNALLMEAEAENNKLSQLTEALKEEIRRTGRSETRGKHLENLEYLKNVVLQFINLGAFLFYFKLL